MKNEAQATARLHHQHIVPVHATGCERGVHYYAIKRFEVIELSETDCVVRVNREPRFRLPFFTLFDPIRDIMGQSATPTSRQHPE
jgi:hypothetical protein